MGTSKPYGGLKDSPPLLPDYALPPPEAEAEPAQPDAEQDTEQAPAPDDVGAKEQVQDPNGEDEEKPTPTAKVKPWQSAKSSMTSAVGAGGGKRAIGRAGAKYVGAKGGARQAASSAVSGRASTARVGQFVSNVISGGIRGALASLNLTHLLGGDATEVFAAIANAISPTGSTLEEAAARQATSDVLAELFNKYVEGDGDISNLDNLNEEDVRFAVENSICLYIYYRWLEELGLRIEENAKSPEEAVRLERDVKVYIKESIKLEFENRNINEIDWNGKEGQKIVNDLYEEAYSLLEE